MQPKLAVLVQEPSVTSVPASRKKAAKKEQEAALLQR
jgi:hypothetical protein